MSEKSLEEMFASTLLKDSTEKLQEIVSNKITEIEKQLVNKIDRMQDRVEEKVSNLEDSISSKPITVNLGTVEKPKEKIVHYAFNTVLDILKSSKRIEKNIMLVGECGCVDCDTEYFNGKEWVKISEYKSGDKVLEYDSQTNNAILSYPLKYIKKPCDKMYHIHSQYGIDQMVSEEHNIAYLTSKNNFYKQKAIDFVSRYNKSKNGLSDRFITTFKYNGNGINLSDNEIKIMLAVICDGSLNKNRCIFNIKKERKKEELRKIFKESNYKYLETNGSINGYTRFSIKPPILTKIIPDEWYNCSQHQLQLICDNILKWDGSISNNRMSFSTTIKKHADFVQFAFSACGYRATISCLNRIGKSRIINGKEYKYKSIEYTVSITKRKYCTLNNANKDNIDIVSTKDGYKYCFTMPTSNLILRRNDKIFITGNSGKSSLCSDVAEALNLKFYPMSVGLQTTKSDLLGFINAKGEYVTTPVRQAFENGGVLLLDEFDATHAGVITILNSMLANGICSFPDKIVEKNPNFICIVACNTYGKGGSIDYIGRNRLDGATLDRFITVSVDYDINLEEKLVNNPNWMNVVNKIRANIQKQGLKVIVSPRASMQGADLLDSGFKIEDVIDMCIFKGCSKDIKSKLLEGVDLSVVNKKKATKNRKKVNPNNPIEVRINFDSGEYCCANVQDSTSIISSVDWEGSYNIYISSRSEWAVPCLNNFELFLNCGNNLNIKTYSEKNINDFIKCLTLYCSSFVLVDGVQPIVITTIFNGETKTFNLGA